MKKLFISIFTAVFALFALGTSTFAWFSMNTQASATGMEVKAIAGSSLQISKDTHFVSGQTSYAFTEGAYVLKPATKFDSQNGVSSAPESHLVTVKNTGDINPATGLPKEGKTLEYEAATTPSTLGSDPFNGYYVDYVLNFAAEGTETDIEAGKLKLTIAAPAASVFEGQDPESDPVLKAVTIMVLYKQADDTDEATACADVIRLLNGTPTSGDGYVICELGNGLHIPAAVNGNTNHPDALQVTLRVYVDGAFLEPAGTSTYVRNTAIVDLTKSLGFAATFDLVIPE